MWGLKKVYYRIYQFVMGLGMKLIPWIEPTIIDGKDSIKNYLRLLKEKASKVFLWSPIRVL